MDGLLVPILSVVAGISILWGNIGALTQPNVKKIMGFSGIANTGYMLVGVVALFSIENAAYVIMFYLCTYLLASFAVFGVMSAVATKEDETQEIYDYEGLLKNEPLLAFILTAGLGSLAGVPPLVGFIGKTLLFILAFQAGLYGLLAVSVIGAVISVYYYFGWLRYANFKVFKFSDETEKTFSINTSALQKISLCGLAVLTIIFGLYQGVFSTFLQGL
jgi:NADH-quinone oxidoreductase subunit N